LIFSQEGIAKPPFSKEAEVLLKEAIAISKRGRLQSGVIGNAGE
jgi:hypothetical protein